MCIATANENGGRLASTGLEGSGRYSAFEAMNPHKFFAELKRRHVYRVAIAYGVVAWLLIQIATQVFPFFEIPNWAERFVVLLLISGLPVALVLAWAFDLTPEGITRTSEITPNEYSRRWSARKFVAPIVTIAMFAAGLLMFQLVRSKSPFLAHIAVAAKSSQKSIAVLPLLNESGDPGDEYFSDGLSEELIAALAQIKELKVIGRSSSFRFKGAAADRRGLSSVAGVRGDPTQQWRGGVARSSTGT